MSWAAEFTQEMRMLKDSGCDFNTAWSRAAQLYPLSPRELGLKSPRLPADLFQSRTATLEEAAAQSWWRGVCERAWLNAPAPGGGPSRLGALPGLVDLLDSDGSASVRRRPPHAMAA